MDKILNNDNKNGLGFYILRGLIGSQILTFILFAVLSIALVNTGLNEKIIKPAIIIISGICVFFGSSIGTRREENKGILKGMIIGLSYFSILYILSSFILHDFSFNLYSIIYLIVSGICGSIGGIIGVNLRKK